MSKYLLVGIILLASLLRLFRLGDIPVGLHRDEAFLGYNAYSILKTGRDMTDNPYPLHLESFLFSPAGYSYAAIPTIAAFGLNPFAVRLPSALAGIFTVIAVYFLVSKLFPQSKHIPTLSFLAATLLAISPWHINLSRTATENTLVVLLLTLATYLFLTYLTNKRIVLFLGSLLLFASTYLIYQAPRAFVPLLVPLLLIFGWRSIPKSHRLWVSVITLLLIFIPVARIISSPTLSVRIRTVSILASQETQLKLDESLRENAIAGVHPFVARLFHNKLTAYTKVVVNNYFQHFSYDFLLTDAGLPDRYRVPGAGIMYLWEALFALVGATILLLQARPLALVLLGWIALAPLGSALTSDDVPNLQRTLIIFPALTLVAAYGLMWTWVQFRKSRWFLPLTYGVALFSLYGFAAYIHAYYVQQVYHRPWYRHEGYKQLVEEVNKLLPQFTKAVITNHESSPTIFFLFYNKTDPHIVQKKWQQDKKTDLNTLSFGQYEFSTETCPVRLSTTPVLKLIGEPGVVYVNFSDCKVADPRVRELSTIRRSDGTEVFRLLEVTP